MISHRHMASNSLATEETIMTRWLCVILAAGLWGCGSSGDDTSLSDSGPNGSDSNVDGAATTGGDATADARSGGDAGTSQEDAPATGDDGALDMDGPQEGSDRSDASLDGGAGCPGVQPFGATTACSGSLVCHYGSATCCGVQYSASTCSCQGGRFSCAQTIECNFVCPDAGTD